MEIKNIMLFAAYRFPSRLCGLCKISIKKYWLHQQLILPAPRIPNPEISLKTPSGRAAVRLTHENRN